MRWRYKVDNPPMRGMGAFAPPAPGQATAAASSWGLVHVAGAPGNMNMPSPKPGGVPDVSMDPRTSPSNVAPDVWHPAVYVTDADNMHPPVPVRPMNVLPYPATDYTRVARTALHAPPRLGGRDALRWPRTFQRWTPAARQQG